MSIFPNFTFSIIKYAIYIFIFSVPISTHVHVFQFNPRYYVKIRYSNPSYFHKKITFYSRKRLRMILNISHSNAKVKNRSLHRMIALALKNQ